MVLKKSTLIIIGALVVIAYIGLSFWLFRPGGLGSSLFKINKSPSIPSSGTPSSTFPLNYTGTETLPPTPTPTPTPPIPVPLTPTPSPKSLIYGCDALGICSVFDSETAKNCPVTFSDPKCSNQCGDASKRCTE